jgi:hypothetical protein
MSDIVLSSHRGERSARAIAINRVAIAFASFLLAFAAGSGGSEGGEPTSAVAGDISPPVSPPSAQPLEHFPKTDMLIPPGALPTSFPAIAQEGTYQFDGNTLPDLKVTSLALTAPKIADAYFHPFIDGTAFPGDATLAKPTGMQFLLPGGGAAVSPVTAESSDTFGDLPSVEFLYDPPGGVTELMAYVIPFSTAINPEGYTYQTFGAYGVVPANLTFLEGYFSTGVPTVTSLPSSGTASYAGKLQGSLLVTSTRDPGDTVAIIAVTVDFATRTLSVVTSSTTSLSDNAAAGESPAASPQLNFSGTLTYAAGSNTFSGTVTTGNGMTGNVTGRFYGAGIAATTAMKAVGSPPEVGGTFAMFAPGVGAMLGAFGTQ